MSDILVVDDVALLRDAIVSALRREGFDVLSADNGRIALRLAHKFRPRLILLDISMPEMDGIACLEALRAEPETAGVPVIMLTDVADRDVVLRAAHLGVRGYLRKSSFSLDDMLAKVRDVIGSPGAYARPRIHAPPRITPAARPLYAAAGNAGPGVSPSAAAVMAPPPPTAAANSTPSHAGGRRVVSSPAASEGADFGGQGLKSTEVLDRILRHQRLHAIPPVLHHVLGLTHSSTSSIQEIADAVRNDPALAVSVMKIANSSFYRGGKRVQTLQDAAQRVGVSSIANTITAVLAFQHFSTTSDAGIVPQRFWEHCLATAVLSEQIAAAVRADETENLFLAGLLHDIGRIMLCEAFPAEYGKALAHSTRTNTDLVQVEPKMFGLTHADVTREVLRHLKLPDHVIDAAWQHELPAGRLDAPKHRGALIVAAANRVAHALAMGDSGSAMLLDLAEHFTPLDLSPEKLETIVGDTAKVMADRKLFYASQSDEQFGSSLATELAQMADAVRAAVPLATPLASAPWLFCQQMKWLDDKPNVAVLCARSESEMPSFSKALEELDAAIEGKVGILVASPDGQVEPPAALRAGRAWGTAAYPGGYRPFVEALAMVAREAAS